MKTNHIPAGEFKAKCLQLMNEVNAKHIDIVITKRGKPIAKLVPIDDEDKSFFGCLYGTVTVKGDILAPLEEKWEADQ